ncbi:MAG: hypothetical protein ABSH06_29820 [Thermodesulfobacteriota bacterium]
MAIGGRDGRKAAESLVRTRLCATRFTFPVRLVTEPSRLAQNLDRGTGFLFPFGPSKEMSLGRPFRLSRTLALLTLSRLGVDGRWVATRLEFILGWVVVQFGISWAGRRNDYGEFHAASGVSYLNIERFGIALPSRAMLWLAGDRNLHSVFSSYFVETYRVALAQNFHKIARYIYFCGI